MILRVAASTCAFLAARFSRLFRRLNRCGDICRSRDLNSPCLVRSSILHRSFTRESMIRYDRSESRTPYFPFSALSDREISRLRFTLLTRPVDVACLLFQQRLPRSRAVLLSPLIPHKRKYIISISQVSVSTRARARAEMRVEHLQNAINDKITAVVMRDNPQNDGERMTRLFHWW